MPPGETRCVITRSDPGYPPMLCDLSDPPPALYVRGDPTALLRPCLSIVGARRSTPYGRAVAQMAARIAAEAGLAVVSGGARGCDHAAGTAAMDAGGAHIAVLGCGADVAYPRTSKPMLDRAIASGGAVVSLDPWGTSPRKWAFPKRNRIIAALSAALVVTEAGLPSGTFTTASAANELDRELLAIPGSIFSAESRGSNYLIASGATCIADEEDLELAISRIYGTLRFCRPDAGGIPGLNPGEAALADALAASPLRGDEAARVLGLPEHEAIIALSDLQVRGIIERQLDGRFALSERSLHARTALGHNGGR